MAPEAGFLARSSNLRERGGWSVEGHLLFDAWFSRAPRTPILEPIAFGRLDDLRVSTGNRLEAVRGNRAGQQGVCVNNQFRKCFRWSDAGPEDVEIVDYH